MTDLDALEKRIRAVGGLPELLRSDVLAFISTLRSRDAEVAGLRRALEPFARVAEHDIGSDEADTDRFQPMSIQNRAPLITVGDLRSASRALAGGEHE